MTEKIEASSLGKILAECPGSIVIIVCFFIINALFFNFILKLRLGNKTHVERSIPLSVIYFEMFSYFFASCLLIVLGILKTEKETIDDITAISFFVVFVFLAWAIVGMFAYLDYKNNKPNLEYQKMWDELDEELYIIEEERNRLSIKIPNNDELKKFHDMVNKYNAKLEIFNAKGEQLK